MDKRKKAVLSKRPTRRELVTGILTVAGSITAGGVLAHAQQSMNEAQSAGVEGLLTYLHQEIEVTAKPERVYSALLDSKQFAAFTTMAADISREPGGTFSLFSGRIVGRNVELISNQRIVQAWRPSTWDPGVYSLVKFEFKEQASGTQIILDHTGFPEGSFRHLNAGWYSHYWEPLKKYLA